MPPSRKPATSSLRIDRFVRPFTLEQVQSLLSETGTISSFWMDDIKTHCYVTVSAFNMSFKQQHSMTLQFREREELYGRDRKPKGARTARERRWSWYQTSCRTGRLPGRPVCTNVHRIVHRIARSTIAGVGNMKNICESLSWITARSIDWINWIMVGAVSYTHLTLPTRG